MFSTFAIDQKVTQNVILGKEIASVVNQAFSISSIKSFTSLVPENQLDMTLIVKRTKDEIGIHWPSIIIDSVVFDNKKCIFTRFDRYNRFTRITEGFESKSLPPLAFGQNVLLFGLYAYLSPVSLKEGNFGKEGRSNFIPGNIKAGNYKIYSTIKTIRGTKPTPVFDLVCFQIEISPSKLPKTDLEYLENLKTRFSSLGVCSIYAGKTPSKEMFLPLQDEVFINQLKAFAKTSFLHKKILAPSIAYGFLRQYKNIFCETLGGFTNFESFSNNELFFDMYSDLVLDIYKKDKTAGLMLLIEGPGGISVKMLERLGIKNQQLLRGSIIPINLLN